MSLINILDQIMILTFIKCLFMSQALCQRFYPYYLPSQECYETDTVMSFRYDEEKPRAHGIKLFAKVSVHIHKT